MNKSQVEDRNEQELAKVHAPFADLVRELLPKLWDAFGHYPLITDGFRTREEQVELYAQGRTKPGNIVTWTIDGSQHIYGKAVDFGFIDKDTGGLTYNIDWAKFGKLVESIPGLDWGFSLWGVDKPHVQFNEEEAKTKESKRLTDLEWCQKHLPEVDWSEAIKTAPWAPTSHRAMALRIKGWFVPES